MERRRRVRAHRGQRAFRSPWHPAVDPAPRFHPSDEISAGDSLADVETDKATMSFDSNEDGVVARLFVEEGTSGVAVGAVRLLRAAVCACVRACFVLCESRSRFCFPLAAAAAAAHSPSSCLWTTPTLSPPLRTTSPRCVACQSPVDAPQSPLCPPS